MSDALTRARPRFPTLRDRTYFAGQCLGAYPEAMLEDLRAYAESLALRSRAIPEWADRWDELHRLTEQLIEATPGSVFLRDSATAAHAAVVASLEPRGPRNRILVGTGDFHSTRYLFGAQRRRGFEVVEIEANGELHSSAETFLPFIDDRVRIVALSLVSPRTGALLDVRPIAEAARAHGALVIVDAYQAVGVVPVRVRDLGADVVIGGFHKWVGGGGTGLAFGWVAPALVDALEPSFPGWLGHKELLGFRDAFEPAPGARKLQQGMPAMEPIYTSRAGIRWVLETGIDRIRARSLELTQELVMLAGELGLALRTPTAPARRGGMVCLDVPDPPRVVSALAARGIDVDSRPGAGLRIGPHPCSTEAECAHVFERVRELVR
jgi:kynureninase